MFWRVLFSFSLVFAGSALKAWSADAADAPLEFAPLGPQFLAQHCLRCHGDEKHEGSLTLLPFKDNTAVIRSRKTWLTILKRVEAGEMPPEDEPRPSKAEIDGLGTLVRGLYADHDRHAKPDAGRVTARRLNRVEYANTVRDLLGIDVNPAEDFPTDDIGYGFDNIGDVLTLSPVLIERYLNAAEQIAERAITPVPPPGTKRFTDEIALDPRERGMRDDKTRPITTKPDEKPVRAGPLSTKYDVPNGSEYRFRVRVYKEAEAGQPVKAAILAGGDNIGQAATDAETALLAGTEVQSLRPFVIVKSWDVQATTIEDAETIEVFLPANIGLKRMAVALFKTPEDRPPVSLQVDFFELEGPLDTYPASHRRLLARDKTQPQEVQTREVLTRLMSRAYRRPPEPMELQRLTDLVQRFVTDGLSWETAMQRALTVVLVSPKFLFRLELDDRPEAPEPRALSEFQLASRLSYFLWSTMPDEELFALAAKGELTASLDAQVKRMLADKRSMALVENFGLQWLQLQRLRSVQPDPKQFPLFNDRMRKAMEQETILFMAEIIREDRSILDFLDADFTYLNGSLGMLYGIADTNGNGIGEDPKRVKGEPIPRREFVRVSLLPGQRGGLPTQASILTVTSNPTRTSPVKRGKWILEQLLGDPPPAPPPNVPELAEGDQAALSGSLRQRMEQHRAKPMCATCHNRMDPMGFALENYDPIGRWRTKDGEFPIETAGSLPDGTSFLGPADFKQILRDRKDQFSRCLIEKLMTYGLGRGIEYYDRPVIDRIQTAVAQGNYRFSTVVQEIVRSEPFRFRRGLESMP